MEIKELQIDGFGTISGETCAFEAPVTVVFGPNEAGKSTLLRFIRTMLYGFANRSQPAERAEPVYGGRHGGRMVLSDQGRLFVLERYGDVAVRRGGAAATLRDENGPELALSQAELERRLLGGVSERLFRQLFAVTLDELQELRSLAGEEVGNYLYHAGMAGGAALTAANKLLEAERDKLYKPRGTQPELNRLLARLRELEAELRRARGGEGEFNEATLELEAIERQLAAAEADVPELRRRLASVQGACEARQWWLRLREIDLEEAELTSQLPDPQAPPLPEDAAARWEKLREERLQAERLRGQAEAELDGLRRMRAALDWDARLLERLPDIEALEERREAAAARREELAELAADVRLQEETLAALLARLSPEWGAEEAAAFAALAEKERARALQAGLAGAERELERLDAELRRVARQRAALAAEAGGDEGETLAAVMAAGRSIGEVGLEERNADADVAAAEGVSRATGVLEGYGGFVPEGREALRRAWTALEDELREWERAKLAAAFAEAGAGGGSAAEAADGGRGRGRGMPSSRSERAQRKRGGESRLAPLAPLAQAALAALGAIAAALPPALGLTGAAQAALFALAAALLAAAGALWLAGRSMRQAAGGGTRGGAGMGEGGTAGVPAAEAAARLREARAALAAAERNAAAAARALLRRPEEAAAALLAGGAPAGADAAAADAAAWREETEAARRALREAVHLELDRLEREAHAREAKRDAQRRLAEWAREQEQLRREREAAAEARDGQLREWQGWLAARKLPPGLPPELLPELFQLAEQALQTLRQRDRLAERAAALQAAIAAFEADAAPLLALAPAGTAAGGDAALAVKLLHREALRQRETAAEAGRLDERLRQAEAAAASARAALEAADAAVRAAIGAAGDADEAAYERRLRVDERRRSLARERREAGLRLAAGHDASGLAAIEGLLARHDDAALAMLLREAQDDLRGRERQVAELLERRGRTAQRLERLRQEAEAEDRLVAHEELLAEFDRLADRYAVLSLTAELIRRTKTVFEEERQPEVLLKASAYFAKMTDGAYARIVAPAEGDTLLAETGDRRTIDGSMLSRGTREQMYLALRFALAGATSPSQALPLLLDDLFVHFDAARLARTAEVLGSVSAERQVVLFTCHEHVARTVASALPGAQVIAMARRGAPGGASGLFRSGTSSLD